MRILIATATAGGGHLQAAAALEEAWHLKHPKDIVQRLDILDFTPRLYRKAYSEGYVRMAEKIPELYAHAFRLTDNPAFVRKITTLRRMSARWITRKFIRALNQFKPDVLLCPHFMPLEAMGSLDKRGLKIPRPLVVCVVTDFEAHALWMEPSVDLYCVAMPGTKARLVARGVPAAKVIVTGIPISQRFVKPVPRVKARRELGVHPTLPGVLVLGGGMGMGPLVETMNELDRSTHGFQLMVVTGKNEDLRKKLAARRFKHPARVFGFVSNMQTLMAAADVIVTKPGGLTSSEALALGKPLLIVNPLPGQEAANSDFLLEGGAAVKANRLEDLHFRIDQLLQRGRLARMAKAAKRLGRPQAANAVCKAVRAQKV